MSEKLKNCPFCGIAAKLIEKFIGDDVDTYWDVECTNYYCYLHGGAEWCFDTEIEATTKWNTRTPDLAEELRLAKAALGHADAADDDWGGVTELVGVIDGFWEALYNSYNVESREEIEKDCKESWPEGTSPLAVALHFVWKREPKVKVQQIIIEDLAMLLKRIIAGADILDKAQSYLERKNLTGSILRKDKK
jgi:hypothetical protein